MGSVSAGGRQSVAEQSPRAQVIWGAGWVGQRGSLPWRGRPCLGSGPSCACLPSPAGPPAERGVRAAQGCTCRWRRCPVPASI